MICPRCSVAEISPATNKCELCGYTPGGDADVAVAAPEELDQRVKVELGAEFHVDRQLRQSEGARVYAATDALGRSVSLTAISRLQGIDPATAQRIRLAAETAATLDHPHVVPMFSAGAARTLLWYSARFVDARTLAEILEAAPMGLAEVRRVAEQIASALDYAHRRGVSHGGLRADNVLVNADGWAFVADFGIQLALTGTSPTRQGGPSGDQRDFAALVSRCLRLPEHRADVPPLVARAIERAASRQAAERFATVLDFVAALEGRVSAPAPSAIVRRSSPRLLMMPPAPRRRRGWWIVGGVATLLAAAGLWWLLLQPAVPPVVWSESPMAVAPKPPVIPGPEPQPVVRQSRPAADQPAQARVAGPPASRVSPPQAPAARVPAPSVSPPLTPGRLFVNSTPWGQVYVDGQLVGNTPRADLAIAAGLHTLRVVRDGFLPYERVIQVAPGQDLRLTDIVLARP